MMPWLKKNSAVIAAVVITAAFLLLNFLMLTKDVYWLFLLPLAGLVAALFMLKFETGACLSLHFLHLSPSTLHSCRVWSCRCLSSL